jgi:hypothetical protein
MGIALPEAHQQGFAIRKVFLLVNGMHVEDFVNKQKNYSSNQERDCNRGRTLEE